MAFTRKRFEEETLPIADPPGKEGAKAAKPAWTPEQILKDLASCDGGTGVYAKAKAANGKDPVIKAGTPALNGRGQVDVSKGEITLNTNLTQCEATQTAIQELTNLSHKHDFDKFHHDAAAGDLSREHYIRDTEQAEYDGVHNTLTAFDACKDTWKCTTCTKEWARNVKDFDDYYQNYLSSEHKEYYGKEWDKSYKAAHDKNHPDQKP